jgi:hypothetical protein
MPAYRAPALAGDAQDHDGHRQTDDRVEDRGASGDRDRAGDYGK